MCTSGSAVNKPIQVPGAITPTTTSTDNWATLVNQTTAGNDAQRLLFNPSVLTNLGGAITGNFDVASYMTAASKWNVTGGAFGYTPDGIHGNAASYAQVVITPPIT